MDTIEIVGQVAFERLGDRFRGQGAADYGISPWALAVVVTFAAALVLYFLLRLRAARHEESCYHPRRLFRELADAHGLTRAERRLLYKIARRTHPVHPAAIFLEPTSMQQARLMPRFLDRHNEIDALEERLFVVDDTDYQDAA